MRTLTVRLKWQRRLFLGTPELSPSTSVGFMGFRDLHGRCGGNRRIAPKPLNMRLRRHPLAKTTSRKAQGRVATRQVSLQYLAFAVASSCQRWIGKLFQLIRQDASSAIPYPKPAIDAGVEINDRMKGGTEVSESEHMRCGGDRWNIREPLIKSPGRILLA